jgi:hypothetical protein
VATAWSKSGYVINNYAGCPILWESKLQTEIALSSTKSEYITLSQSLPEVTNMIDLIKELQKAGFGFDELPPKVKCKAFEDNNGALKMAMVQQLCPRTKHINGKYHHFRSAVNKGTIELEKIDTTDQIADIFTKPLGVELFQKLRRRMMGW